MFLDDSYLKYIGWTLSDKVGHVRLECLHALLPLYESHELMPRLQLYTNKFKDRIVAMILDRESEVGVLAVKLLTEIAKHSCELLNNDECLRIYEMVYSDHRNLAVAAAEFLNTKVFFPRQEDQVELSQRGKRMSLNTPLLRDLVLFFIESELHSHATYLVDSFVDNNDMLKDWECMTDLLLEDPVNKEHEFDDQQNESMIDIMVCAAKQISTGEPPIGRGHNRRLISHKDQKALQEDKDTMTDHFIVTLPALLGKFIVDKSNVLHLLQIPLYMNLDIYTTMRQDKHLDALLARLEQILERHTDEQVLLAVSSVFQVLCEEEHAFHSKADTALRKQIDALYLKFEKDLLEYNEQGENLEDLDPLRIGLRKIEAFYKCHDLHNWNFWDLAFSLVRVPEEDKPLSEFDDQISANQIRQRLREFFDNCSHWVAQDLKHPHDLAGTAHMTLCDLLLMFSEESLMEQGTSDVIKSLALEATPQRVNVLRRFLDDNVFVKDEEQKEENDYVEFLQKRRAFLSCFCKLIIYNTIDMKCAADIFRHYNSFYHVYGDLIKLTLAKCREINRETCAKTISLALQDLYEDLKESADGENADYDQEPIDRFGQEFIELRDLAKKFALSFGPDQMRQRLAVASIHRDGILYSLQGLGDDEDMIPQNLAFMDIVYEFTSKLMRADKKTVLNFLDKRLANGVRSNAAGWQPLLQYRNSLVQADDLVAQVGPLPSPGTSGAPPHPDVSHGQAPPSTVGPKRKAATSKNAQNGFAPGATSTAVKRRRTNEGIETGDPELDDMEETDEMGDIFDDHPRASFM